MNSFLLFAYLLVFDSFGKTHRPIHERKDIPKQYQWDLGQMYDSYQDWSNDLESIQPLIQKLSIYKTHINESSASLASVLHLNSQISRKVDILFAYAHALKIQDTRNSSAQAMENRVLAVSAQANAATAWIEPEILSMDPERLSELRQDPMLNEWNRYFEILLRSKPHLLSSKEERIMSLMAEPLGMFQSIFSLLANADLKFPNVTVMNEDGSGGNHTEQLTDALLRRFMQHPDRTVRRNAFESMFTTLSSFQNTFVTALAGHVKGDVTRSKIRKFNSSIEASLFDENIPLSVYENLIDSVHRNLPIFYRYLSLIRHSLNVDSLEMYDLHVPLDKSVDTEVTYDEAIEMVLEAIKPLGEEYSSAASRVLKELRWVDPFPNVGKQSGARQMGCYDSPSYISLNFDNTLTDVFTLAHELGHAMHSLYSKRSQPVQYARYKIFVAEVASNVNEILLFDYLMNKEIEKGRELLTKEREKGNMTQTSVNDKRNMTEATNETNNARYPPKALLNTDSSDLSSSSSNSFAPNTINSSETEANSSSSPIIHSQSGDYIATPRLITLIAMKCEKIKGSVFRQTMFAEFEKGLHQLAEGKEITLNGTGTVLRSVTPASLSSLYKELNDLYYGDEEYLEKTNFYFADNNSSNGKGSGQKINNALSTNTNTSKCPRRKMRSTPLIRWEFLRIPHLYVDFYVYKYATSFSAAQLIARNILNKNEVKNQNEQSPTPLEKYIEFLSAGGSKDPLDILGDVGIDMTSPVVVDKAMQSFEEMVNQLEQFLC
ncbi:putative oligoendopeptidase F [Monocercomonoides exilis]|uniref:putative oligoendopeptidase F n=1 Tax=Monocercomonoides exilis TaxID=2049356 RepID=UPI00355947B8|nr:putative oligoendopeptidase F [Monocercomonoides exilis]|eukprot:MONOS_6717.1-p1 / transcript=MONOS_6717.1 / gene=MONOS_6717 / organism=Monocercomonoides_exilis_PA203 / gene_product=oligopeptidase PepB / transcript_product=oligopeptidase PepB / location=Mono_scaffold00216:70053-73111(-) / protein_length=773 / sequence_SO=supercontig / SO=protein_coding / is_pseudo=false